MGFVFLGLPPRACCCAVNPIQCCQFVWKFWKKRKTRREKPVRSMSKRTGMCQIKKTKCCASASPRRERERERWVVPRRSLHEKLAEVVGVWILLLLFGPAGIFMANCPLDGPGKMAKTSNFFVGFSRSTIQWNYRQVDENQLSLSIVNAQE